MRFAATIAMLCLLASGCSDAEKASSPNSNNPDMPTLSASDNQDISNTNATEKVVAALQPKLRKLFAVSAVPDDILSSGFGFRGIANRDESEPAFAESSPSIQHFTFPTSESRSESSGAEILAQIWNPCFNTFGKPENIEDSSIGVLEAELSDSAKEIRMKTLFEGRLTGEAGQLIGIKAKQTLSWQLNEKEEWLLASWRQDSFDTHVTHKPLFEDVTSTAFSKTIADYFSKSKHYDLILERAKDNNMPARLGKFFKYFVDWHSMFRYTSCSVVDIDQDGWDDLFVTDRWGQGKLLRNTGKGSFEDITASCGMDLSQTCANCTLFIDFDNDGDSDALIGQSVNPATFYRNMDGKFVPDEKVNRYISRCKFVTSASAVDINRDGLMDVYLSTYVTGGSADFGWLEYAVDPSDLEELKSRVLKSHSYLDRCGPPNVVLMNRDGNLEEVRVDNTLRQWKCSYQSVWADIDNDGDSDLYICNDFAPDSLLRNDTPRGSFEPVFADVSAEYFDGGQMGFGMGASFGDYDSDGDLDLYVSNMYSKAGNRIFRQLNGNVNERLKLAAQGNFLFRNDGKSFKQVAGLGETDQHVSKVGWSFGGQFADFNNDQKLDLYVPSGFFTPPDQVDSKADL